MGGWLRRIRYLWGRRRFDQDLLEELALHRELKASELRRQGVDPSRAEHESRRLLGSEALAHNRSRDVWLPPWLQELEQDVRTTLRRLIGEKRFAITALAVLSLGLGANLTGFTLANALLLRPLPYDRPERLMVAGLRDANGRDVLPSYLEFQGWRERTRSFAGMFGEIGTAMNLSGEDRPAERLSGSYISFDAFQLLGVTPVVGRTFVEADDRVGAPPVAILGHDVWRTRYGSDPHIVGRLVRVNDVASTIVGVMPAGFMFPFTTEIWQPLALFTGVAAATRGQPRSATPTVVGRLADGVSVEAARDDLVAVTAALAADEGSRMTAGQPTLEPLAARYAEAATGMVSAMMAAVGFLLVIACANLAHLLLARGANRTHEYVIRASLGATRWRLMREQLIECILLGVAAAAVGFVISLYGVRLIVVALSRNGASPAPWADWSPDARVYLFLAASSVFATLAVGIVPAIHASLANPNDQLRDSARTVTAGVRAGRWGSALVIAELALTLMLLTGSSLMLRSVEAMAQTARVVDTSGLTTMRLAVANQKYPTPEARRRVFEQLNARLSQLPGLSSVTIASDIPLLAMSVDGLVTRQVEVEGHERRVETPLPTIARVYVGPNYFPTLGVPIVRGRDFEPADGRSGQQGAVVNERFVSMFLAGRDPLGARVRLSTPNSSEGQSEWLTVVGVTRTIPQAIFASDHGPMVYLPVEAEPQPHRFASIIARGQPGVPVVAAIREVVRSIDPDLPGYFIETMEEVVNRGVAGQRFSGSMTGILAMIGLGLAAVGLYAVTAQGVVQRTPEVGVRMALGARAPQIVWLFARRAALQLAAAVAIGLAGSLAIDTSLRTMFIGTAARDPVTFVSVAGFLVAVAAAACVLPLRRALALSPTRALRVQ